MRRKGCDACGRQTGDNVASTPEKPAYPSMLANLERRCLAVRYGLDYIDSGVFAGSLEG